MINLSLIITATFVFTLLSCQTTKYGQLVYPDKLYNKIEWTEEEKAKDISVRNISGTEDSSTHLIRLQGKEFPHYHDYHDLNVTIISGRSTIHFKNRMVSLKPGDVISIPKGTYHWAENTGSESSVVFAVFSPPFDGKDRRREN